MEAFMEAKRKKKCGKKLESINARLHKTNKVNEPLALVKKV